MSRRRFAVTIWKDDLKSLVYDNSKIRYAIFGLEKCPTTKKVHIQGYIETFKKIRYNAVKKIFNDKTMHVGNAIADRKDNINYCKKDGNYIEFNESENLTETITRLVNEQYTDMKLLTEHPEIYHKNYDLYCRIKKTIEDDRSRTKFINYWKEYKLNKTQEYMYRIIKDSKDVRKIIWFYDEKGNSGKSTLCNYILATMDNIIILNNAKNSDIAYIYNNEKLILFDFPRTLEDKVNYTVIENLKNCRILNTKYHVHNKFFECPTIVVFANFKPDKTKLSKDRWAIYKIAPGIAMPVLDW